MDKNEKAPNSSKDNAEGRRKNAFTTHEKAQYEVFANGSIPREQFEGWVKDDLRAIRSFVNVIMGEPEVFAKIVDVYWNHYQKLHTTAKTNEDASIQAK